jgi:hypothetical protein
MTPMADREARNPSTGHDVGRRALGVHRLCPIRAAGRVRLHHQLLKRPPRGCSRRNEVNLGHPAGTQRCRSLGGCCGRACPTRAARPDQRHRPVRVNRVEQEARSRARPSELDHAVGSRAAAVAGAALPAPGQPAPAGWPHPACAVTRRGDRGPCGPRRTAWPRSVRWSGARRRPRAPRPARRNPSCHQDIISRPRSGIRGSSVADQ